MINTLGFERAIDTMSSDEFMGLVAIVGFLLVCALAVVFSLSYAMLRKKQFEQTRREIAAYVAEGSMSTDDARNLLEAGRIASKHRH